MKKNHIVEKKQIRPFASICILDWGIGGIGFYKYFKKKHPDKLVLYISDSAEIPYGKLHRSQLLSRLREVIFFCREHSITHIVVACNAMSTVLPLLKTDDFYQLKITGVIEPTIETLQRINGKTCGIIGGRRTILSRAYLNPIKLTGKTVKQRIAQPLSAMIETGKINTAEFESRLSQIIMPLRYVDILILACTHYPVAVDSFRKYIVNARIIDPAKETVEWVELNWTIPEVSGCDMFLTTGNRRIMKIAAKKVFDIEILTVLSFSEGSGCQLYRCA